jgi:hypothetical protein
VGLVVDQFEVPICEPEDVAHLRVEFHFREGQGLTGELQFDLLEMVGINMYVAAGPDEVSRLVPCDLGHHEGQQGIGGDVEGYSQEDVAAPLVKLAGEFTSGHIKLKEEMAWGKMHFLQVAHIPGADDMPA